MPQTFSWGATFLLTDFLRTFTDHAAVRDATSRKIERRRSLLQRVRDLESVSRGCWRLRMKLYPWKSSSWMAIARRMTVRRLPGAIEANHAEIVLIAHAKNQGKGAALRTGIKGATGDFVAVQDADLEYDPQDLKKILAPLLSGDADVVLGSRFLSSSVHRVLYFWHYLANACSPCSQICSPI